MTDTKEVRHTTLADLIDQTQIETLRDLLKGMAEASPAWHKEIYARLSQLNETHDDEEGTIVDDASSPSVVEVDPPETAARPSARRSATDAGLTEVSGSAARRARTDEGSRRHVTRCTKCGLPVEETNEDEPCEYHPGKVVFTSYSGSKEYYDAAEQLIDDDAGGLCIVSDVQFTWTCCDEEIVERIGCTEDCHSFSGRNKQTMFSQVEALRDELGETDLRRR